MLKRVVLALAVLVVGLATVVVSRPSTYRVERSTPIAAPAEIPFGLVNDLHRWQYWSPWEEQEPAPRRSYDGAYAGPEALYAWSGGTRGKVAHLEAELYTRILLQVDLLAPRARTGTFTFTFQPIPGGTSLNLVMEGQRGFMAKAASLFTDEEAQVGAELDKALASLKGLSETEVKNRAERDVLIKARDKAAAQPPTPPPAPPAP